MQTIISLFEYTAYLDIPVQKSGWIGLIIFSALMIAGIFYGIKINRPKSNRQIVLFLICLLLVPITSLFIGIDFTDTFENSIWRTVPGIPAVTPSLIIMVFSALPWVIACLILPAFLAIIVALFSGFFIALFQTHSIFTIFIIAINALLFCKYTQQNYRTSFFRLIRHPLLSSVLISFTVIPMFAITSLFEINAPIEVRIDYSISHNWIYGLLRWGEILFAGIIGEILYLVKVNIKSGQQEENISPFESGIESKAIAGFVPIFIILTGMYFIVNWFIVLNNEREALKSRLSNVAITTSNSLSLSIEYGKNLIHQIGNNDKLIIALDIEEINSELEILMKASPFFTQLLLFNEEGELIGGSPMYNEEHNWRTEEETAGISLALNGVPGQIYSISGMNGRYTSKLSFITPVKNEEDEIIAVLLGRSDLESSPITKPAFQLLEGISRDGGNWMIIDEHNNVVFHSYSNQIIKNYVSNFSKDDYFMDEISATGSRYFRLSQPVVGQSWTILINMPFKIVLARNIANIFINYFFILFIGIISIWMLQKYLHGVSTTVMKLSQEVRKSSQEQFNHPISINGVDEIGRLGNTLEKMRQSIKGRQDELNRIMMVRKGVPSNLDVRSAIHHVVDACLLDNANVARVILDSSVLIDRISEPFIAFGAGEKAKLYSYLDDQIFNLMKNQGMLIIPNTKRMRVLQLRNGKQLPAAMIIAPLHHENKFLGALWIGFEEVRTFPDEWLRLIELIVVETSLVIANICLFTSAEVDRHRFEAALSALPDPVIVFSDEMRLLLVNPAALIIQGLIASSSPGSILDDVIEHRKLLEIISVQPEGQIFTEEIDMPDGRTFQASVSRIVNNNITAGTVCVLKEISQYKALDAIKSEFVSTVSHDLRSPLTQISGYVTMLQMLGNLNEQQNDYIEKINNGLEEMTHLISNLLDLGRIEAGVGLKIEKIRVTDIVDQIIKSLQPRINQKKLSVNLTESNDEMIFEVDVALINQALMNLIDNAIKYTPVNGSIQINIKKNNETICFEIHDTGIGIAPIDIPHIFDKFYLVGRRGSNEHKGVGLGLSIVKSIADRHHGRVWVDSQLGKGSIFYLDVPIRYYQ